MMKNCRPAKAMFFCLWACVISCAGERGMKQRSARIRASLDKTLSSPLYRGVRTGILVADAKSGTVLYSNLENERLMVASVLKLVPSAACLMLLGEEYRFTTPVLLDGPVENGAVKGNIYIEGKGDPSLNPGHLRQASLEMREKGIRAIEGDLVYDVSFLDEEKNRYGNNARNLYAPASALCVNYNWIDVKVERKEPPLLSLAPGTAYARLEFDVNFSDSEIPGRPEMTFEPFEWGDLFRIRGTITAWDRQFHYVWLGVSRPGLYAATLFQEACLKNGIRIIGRIRKGAVPSSARPLVLLKGSPLKEILKSMNRESNNVIAETLCKDLGALFHSVPGTRSKGTEVLKKFCAERLKMGQGEFSIADASGLDPGNTFTPRQIVSVLNALYRNGKLYRPFLESLAEQGVHPYALQPVPPPGVSCFVKSGTLSVQGVNTVAGYIILDRPARVFSFAVLANRAEPGPMTYSGTLTNPLLEALLGSVKE